MSERFRMPILSQMKCLGHVTFEATADIRSQAIRNHGQQLERLRARGGVSWVELYCLYHTKRLNDVQHNAKTQEIAKDYFVEVLKLEWEPS